MFVVKRELLISNMVWDVDFAVVSGFLSGPTNVHLSSTNMDLVLRWGPPEGAPDNVTYSTEYRSVQP